MGYEDGAPDLIRAPSLPFLRLEIANEGDPAADLGPMAGRALHWKDVEGRTGVSTALHASGAWIDVVGVARFALDGTDVVTAWPEPGRGEAAVRDCFSRTVLPLALTYWGAQYLHASAVVGPNGVVALCGASGTGKSTVAAGLTRRGLASWGDDAVVFTTDSPSRAPISVRLPSQPRLDPEAFSLVRALPRRPPKEETAPACPLAAVVLLERGNVATPTCHALGAGQAVSGILEHALCLSYDDDARRRRLASDYLEVAALVRVLRLTFNGERDQFPALVDAVIEATDCMA